MDFDIPAAHNLLGHQNTSNNKNDKNDASTKSTPPAAPTAPQQPRSPYSKSSRFDLSDKLHHAMKNAESMRNTVMHIRSGSFDTRVICLVWVGILSGAALSATLKKH